MPASSYKKMAGEDADGEDSKGAPPSAPAQTSTKAPSSAPLPRSSSLSTGRSSGGRSLDDNYVQRSASSRQQLRSGLSIDHPLFRQRGLGSGSKDIDGAASEALRAQLASDAQENDNDGEEVAGDSSSPSAPLLPDAKPSLPKAMPRTLTRTTSTPEATKYHPLGQEEADLTHPYPLLLQRSASSAFGSPSSFGKLKPRRTHSTSGNSDPGASAFHPVCCKSISNDSAGSATGSLAGSDIGSAVSSTAFGSTGRLSVHSDPLGRSLSDRKDKASNSSPWRKFSASRVMASLKKGKSSKKHLSGRENPARPEFGGEEGGLEGCDLGCGMVLPRELSFRGPAVMEGIEAADSAMAKEPKTSGDNEANASGEPGSGSGSAPKPSSKGGSRKKKNGKASKSSSSKEDDRPKSTVAKEPSAEHVYADPGVALDLSDSDEEDDDDIGPIIGNYISLDDSGRDPRPPSVDLSRPPSTDDQEPHPSVEVVSTSVTPTLLSGDLDSSFTVMEETAGPVRIFSPSTIEEENSPSSTDRTTTDDEIESANVPFHPLGGDRQEASAAAQGGAATGKAKLKYRSPQRAQPQALTSNAGRGSQNSPSSHGSPDSRLSSAGSPASRISSSNSRATTLSGDRTVNTLQTEGSSVAGGADSEVREANRRSVRGGRGRGDDNQEVAPGPDGCDTVFSSSTTSSNLHSYLHSPRTLRDGATMPVDRFFAGGNITLSPSPSRAGHPSDQSTVAGAPTISKFITLSPNKLSRVGGGSALSGGSSTGGRDAAHSPHTISSNSVSAHSSSSGSEAAKKPLKFVAYNVREQRESPFDEPPMGPIQREASSLIKPRISKKPPQRNLPPIQKAPLPKPPQSPRTSPRKLAMDRLSGARTPTRTPPPSSYRDSSGGNTPCSPPVIIDGPNVLCGDLSSTRPKRPSVVRRASAHGGRGIFLLPPTTSYRPQQHPQPATAAGASVGCTNDGAQEAQEIALTTGASEKTTAGERTIAAVSPERQPDTASATEGFGDKGGAVAVVSPEKGF